MLASPFYLHTWKKFLFDEGVLDSNRIKRKEFQSHGIDVNKQNVNPHMNKGQKNFCLLNIFQDQKEKRVKIFLDIAIPQIQNMRKTIDELQMMALLIDPDGYVLSLSGNKQNVATSETY